jgi:hypothetical protein
MKWCEIASPDLVGVAMTHESGIPLYHLRGLVFGLYSRITVSPDKRHVEGSMDKLEQVTYCGLYCGLCSQRNRIPQRARALRQFMQKEGWDFWGKEQAYFNEFWSFLSKLADNESQYSCRTGRCGPPFCGIRKCAREKGIEVCPFCSDYPCNRILGIAKGYPTMLADGKRMKDSGIDAWIQEQEERRKTGFAYVDIRYYPYEVPDK